VDADRDSHQHVLWAFNRLIVTLEQVPSLQSLEAEEIVVEITLVVKSLVDQVRILADALVDIVGKEGCLSSYLVLKVVELVGDLPDVVEGPVVEGCDCDSVRKHRIVGMHNGHIGTGLCGQS